MACAWPVLGLSRDTSMAFNQNHTHHDNVDLSRMTRWTEESA